MSNNFSKSLFSNALLEMMSTTLSIPIVNLISKEQGLHITIGLGLPISVLPRLEKIGLFEHKLAEKIAKSVFETSGKTLTGHWMDATGIFSHNYPKNISVGWHRIQNHHFITDSLKTLVEPDLSIVDFWKHMATDVVTKNGLPILPECFVRTISDVLGISASKLMPWMSLNILDLSSSVFSISHAGANLISILNGVAQWNVKYALNTIGVGGLEIFSGLTTKNPILIGSGCVDIGCGIATAYKYYSQPFFCGVPIASLIDAVLIGGALGSVIGALDFYFNKIDTTKEKSYKLLETIGTSAFMSSLSAISSPLSITVGMGISGFKLAKKWSEHTNNSISALPVTSEFSSNLDEFIAYQNIGKSKVSRMLSYLDNET